MLTAIVNLKMAHFENVTQKLGIASHSVYLKARTVSLHDALHVFASELLDRGVSPLKL